VFRKQVRRNAAHNLGHDPCRWRGWGRLGGVRGKAPGTVYQTSRGRQFTDRWGDTSKAFIRGGWGVIVWVLSLCFVSLIKAKHTVLDR